MSQVNDEKLRALRSALVKDDGSIDDLELQWLQTFVGVTAEQINDAWHEYLDNVIPPVLGGALNDRFVYWLEQLGYSGALDDMWLDYWSALV